MTDDSLVDLVECSFCTFMFMWDYVLVGLCASLCLKTNVYSYQIYCNTNYKKSFLYNKIANFRL